MPPIKARSDKPELTNCEDTQTVIRHFLDLVAYRKIWLTTIIPKNITGIVIEKSGAGGVNIGVLVAFSDKSKMDPRLPQNHYLLVFPAQGYFINGSTHIDRRNIGKSGIIEMPLNVVYSNTDNTDSGLNLIQEYNTGSVPDLTVLFAPKELRYDNGWPVFSEEQRSTMERIIEDTQILNI